LIIPNNGTTYPTVLQSSLLQYTIIDHLYGQVLARRVMGPGELEAGNPNLVGGDINGGAQDLGQLWRRPVSMWRPYATPIERVWLCSSSTPPGGGVHGMCGYWGAREAIKAGRD
jgi:phytoene dehydrogenase-like protein